jgi:hypothetical protein
MLNAVAIPQDDPWKQLVAVYDQQASLQGRFLKFSKGFWLVGTDELPRGTKLVARVDELQHGWTKWKGNRPVDHRIGQVAKHFFVPLRDDLDDNAPCDWETDQNGVPKDPWVYTYYLPLLGPDPFIFSTSSFGGKKAIRNLSEAYTKRTAPELVPVVSLGVNQRKHREFGNIPEPTFTVVEWVDATTL